MISNLHLGDLVNTCERLNVIFILRLDTLSHAVLLPKRNNALKFRHLQMEAVTRGGRRAGVRGDAADDQLPP